MIPVQFPAHELTQNDFEEAEQYAIAVVDYFFREKGQPKTAERIYRAKVGYFGELAFYNLLPDNLKTECMWFAKDERFTEKRMKSLIDFIVEGKSIDIKTSDVSPWVKRPSQCNFVIGNRSISDYKAWKNSPDYFVQCLFDGKKVYIIGSISKELFSRYLDGSAQWDRQFNGGYIITQQNFDKTNTFFEYFKSNNEVAWLQA